MSAPESFGEWLLRRQRALDLMQEALARRRQKVYIDLPWGVK